MVVSLNGRRLEDDVTRFKLQILGNLSIGSLFNKIAKALID